MNDEEDVHTGWSIAKFTSEGIFKTSRFIAKTYKKSEEWENRQELLRAKARLYVKALKGQ